MHLTSVQLINNISTLEQYPFIVPTIRTLPKLHLNTSVTFFVGENGTGKSTLLEAIAANIGSIRVGDKSMDTDDEMLPARALAKQIRLSWKIKTRRGMFLRAEDFITYTKHLSNIREEMEAEIIQAEKDYKQRSPLAQSLAKLPYKKSLFEMDNQYRGDLQMKSHGESFLDFFKGRFQANALYLLDEPETPLSPLKQIAFIAMMKEMVEQNAQFIIATHSPILMAYPGATIYSFDQSPITEVDYEQLEHVNLTRDFLNRPEQFLRNL